MILLIFSVGGNRGGDVGAEFPTNKRVLRGNAPSLEEVSFWIFPKTKTLVSTCESLKLVNP